MTVPPEAKFSLLFLGEWGNGAGTKERKLKQNKHEELKVGQAPRRCTAGTVFGCWGLEEALQKLVLYLHSIRRRAAEEPRTAKAGLGGRRVPDRSCLQGNVVIICTLHFQCQAQHK